MTNPDNGKSTAIKLIAHAIVQATIIGVGVWFGFKAK